MNKSITLFVAAYNKQKYIYGVLEKIYRAAKAAEIDYEIIIINDCSADKTEQEVIKFLNEHPDENITLINNEENLGLAKNFAKSVELSKKKYLRLINGDDSESLDFHIKILKLVGAIDLIIPYYTEISGRSKARNLISGFFTKVINLVSGNKLLYYNGAPIMKVSDLKKISPMPLGMTYSSELLVKLVKMDINFIQIPTKAVSRGKSNAINIHNIVIALGAIYRILIGRFKS